MEVEGIKLKSFKYLGVPIHSNGKQEAIVNERINTTMEIYYRNF